MKIYTKTGDKGQTSLFSGQRVAKNDPLVNALGSVDECNSAIGVAVSQLPEDKDFDLVRGQLTTIQHALFDLGAALATPKSQASASKLKRTRFDQREVEDLEKWIDEMEAQLPKLTAFILPGGHPSGAQLHLARSLCRRAERAVTPINEREDVNDDVIIFLNRLSDYLFVASRYVNQLLKRPETTWVPHEKSLP